MSWIFVTALWMSLGFNGALIAAVVSLRQRVRRYEGAFSALEGVFSAVEGMVRTEGEGES